MVRGKEMVRGMERREREQHTAKEGWEGMCAINKLFIRAVDEENVTKKELGVGVQKSKGRSAMEVRAKNEI